MLRTHNEPINGKTPEDVLAFIKEVMGLSNVHEISITSEGIVVRRDVESEREDVLPSKETRKTVDVAHLLSKIQLIPWPLDVEKHPYTVIHEVTGKLSQDGYHPTAVLVGEHDRELFSAWMGYEDFTSEYLFGLRVVYWDSNAPDERIIVLGMPTASGYVSEAVIGVVVDLE